MEILKKIKWAFSPFVATETVVEVAVEKTVDTVISAFSTAVADLQEVATRSLNERANTIEVIKSYEKRVVDLDAEAKRASAIAEKLSAILS